MKLFIVFPFIIGGIFLGLALIAVKLRSATRRRFTHPDMGDPTPDSAPETSVSLAPLFSAPIASDDGPVALGGDHHKPPTHPRADPISQPFHPPTSYDGQNSSPSSFDGGPSHPQAH